MCRGQQVLNIDPNGGESYIDDAEPEDPCLV